MTPIFRFHDFSLDPSDRQLKQGDATIDLNARYFDALVLLVSEAGTLVSKDRFLEEIWRGVPVTDEALTQCIKTLRRQLGDRVAVPRFIETVPKHGYRFIAPVTLQNGPSGTPQPSSSGPKSFDRPRFALLGLAGTVGGAAAGMVGGLLYGFATTAPPSAQGVGEASSLLVLICLTVLAGIIGGTGVGFGIAAGSLAGRRSALWTVLGGAIGGLVIGSFARLLGLDSFNLLFGQSPGDITGGAEGGLLGGAVGLGAWLGRHDRPERSIGLAAFLGGAAGIVIPLLGGRMMGGSLDALAHQFPASRLHLGEIGRLFGETAFGPLSQSITGGIEGALFGAGVIGAMALTRHNNVGARDQNLT